MFETFKNAWKIPDLRKKILYTLLMLLIYRIGSFVPVAGINREFIASVVGQNNLLGLIDIISGGSLANFTIFAMGISPYINASIIMQLLTVAIPKLERLSKEGEEGRKKIATYTRYFTVVLGLVQSVGIILSLGSSAVTSTSFFNYFVIGVSLTAGTALTMWIGERITENGVGNGISLLIFVGIISRVPNMLYQAFQAISVGEMSFWVLPIMLVVILALITAVVFVDLGQRRVPVQYAKKVVGRKMYGGQNTHIPMKVNSGGVLPLIFASAIITFPEILCQIFWPNSPFYVWYTQYIGVGSWVYMIIQALLILFFSYFYNTISFNPEEISKNLQQHGGFIPGIRPGRPTMEYLHRVSVRLCFFGAVFLSLMALLPSIFISVGGSMMGSLMRAFGSTSLLITVSVALETSKQIESQMLMRHYKGFLS
ncbi:preprotein translocase subunit SecY [Clostridium sp. BSD2780061688st1 E8]|uniref:preprotein translocase subunit SecY n=1 Tax=unclassified Clostridium TaxID=2614128 RepID=UPI001106ABCC|nr:preprotein translocase subunit SecY [Clostridium sp. BSD2780061688st1 E8]